MITYLYKLFFRFSGIVGGKNLRLNGVPIIVKEKNADLVIGEKCHIKSSFLSNLVGMYQRTIIIARGNSKIHIGDRVGISGGTIYARNEIIIGDRCIIGANAKILDNDFHPADPDVRAETPCDRFASKKIEIGNGVFIGCNSIILKGVKIGDGATIGAGSVVTTDIPPRCVAVGNPARVVKEYK